MPAPKPDRSTLLLAGAVVLCTVVAFGNAAPDAFVYDDANFLPIPRGQDESFWSVATRLFTGDVWRARRLNVDAYRPLTFSSLVADELLYGGHKWGFHVTSIALHVGVSVLLFFVLRTLLQRAGAGPSAAKLACLSAIVFGVHPVHTEAVVSAFNRGDSLVALLTLAALLAVLELEDRNPARAWGLAGVAYLFALFSKESAATLPVLCAGMTLVVHPEESLRDRGKKLLPALALLVPLGAFLVARKLALGHPEWTYAHVLSFGESLRLTVAAFRDALGVVFWPWPLRAVRADYSAESVPFAFVVLIGFGFAVWKSWRTQRGIAVGLLFFALAVLPGLPVVTNIANAQPMAERYLYMPSLGMAVALAFALVWLERRTRASQVAWGVGVVACVLALVTRARNESWHSDVALFEAEVSATPANMEAVMDLGGAYISAGRPDETLALCARYKAGSPVGLERLFTSCARLLEGRNQFDEAEPYFRTGASGDAPPADYIVYARFLVRVGRARAAELEYEKAIQMERDPVRKHTTRAEMLLKLHPERLPEAQKEIDAALSGDPSYEIALNLRRRILAAMAGGAAPPPSMRTEARTPAAPAVAASAQGSVFGDAAIAALARVLAEAPKGSPVWIAARADDAEAVSRADAAAAIFRSSGWNVLKVDRTSVPVRQGVFLYAADSEPPQYVHTVERALTAAGLSPTFAAGYRSYYDEMIRTKPGYQGFPMAAEQTYIVVFGRVR